MGIEWYRDLSITVLGFVAAAVLIFASVMFYQLRCETKSALQSVKEASESVSDTVAMVQEGLRPLLPVLALIQGLLGGVKNIGRIFKK
ncbi:MAG: hypothetical protein RDU76_09585 [Candidatus Edwardsbacteria bacterium]|nr:hypothetical protein [Candidatus Edwardsbacteria bacterium]